MLDRVSNRCISHHINFNHFYQRLVDLGYDGRSVFIDFVSHNICFINICVYSHTSYVQYRNFRNLFEALFWKIALMDLQKYPLQMIRSPSHSIFYQIYTSRIVSFCSVIFSRYSTWRNLRLINQKVWLDGDKFTAYRKLFASRSLRFYRAWSFRIVGRRVYIWETNDIVYRNPQFCTHQRAEAKVWRIEISLDTCQI